MTDHEIHAEAKRRVQRSTPSLTDEQFETWLALALSRGASIVLTLDGALAAYPLPKAFLDLVTRQQSISP